MTARLLLVLGGAMMALSPALPWGHARSHLAILREDAPLILPYARDGEHLVAAYLAARVLALASPMVLGAWLILEGLLAPGRGMALAALTVSALIVVSLASAAWLAFAITDREDLERPLLAAALFLSAMLLVTTAAAVRHLRRGNPSPREAVFVCPLLLFLGGGALAAVGLRQNELWHIQDYVVLAAGSALALAGLWRRAADAQRAPGKSAR
jgi:hypothetical protein